MRPPPSNIRLLLPVWDGRYVHDFLTLCLPSMLAPGNVPALAERAPCTLVLLAPERDAGTIAGHPLWRRLRETCAVETFPIDFLLSQSSSTMLTLAYAAAIRATGDSMRDTCFLPLVSDYVFADGALSNAVKPIFDGGASGVVAGNYQVVAEAAVPALEMLKTDEGILAVPARQLVDLSLKTLHPATLANVVGTGRNAPDVINRLFWRVDDTCMVGRFFLMHMIALRPETDDFVIAAPSDYSLIPELCPSGAVVRLTDSDDYFVMECQPRRWRGHSSRMRRLDAAGVAAGLAVWATREHRDNARHPVVYHTHDTAPALAATLAASSGFIDDVFARDRASPLPSRHHPYWARALKYHAATATANQDTARLAEITGDKAIELWVGDGGRGGTHERLLGRAPDFRPWHPRWADVRALEKALARISNNASVVIVSDAPERVRSWLQATALESGATRVGHISARMIDADRGQADAPEKFEVCLFLGPGKQARDVTEAAESVEFLVERGGVIAVCVGMVFSDQLATILPPAQTGADGGLVIEERTAVPMSRLRAIVQPLMMSHARKASRMAGPLRYLWLASAGGWAIPSFFCNTALALRGRTRTGSRASSSVTIFRSSHATVPISRGSKDGCVGSRSTR